MDGIREEEGRKGIFGENLSASSGPDEVTTLTVLAEPTSACNLDCSYCYKGQKKSTTMDEMVLGSMLSKVISHNEGKDRPSSFVWHGGEPTLVGSRFYGNVFAFIKNLDLRHKVNHTVQTNGTLLTDDLLALFSDQNISIGVSIDGSPEHHNRIRPMKNGGPSYALIMEGLDRARRHGVEVGVLMSVTNDNLGHIREMFDFCRDNRFTFGLNPITADLHSCHKGIEVTPENYLKACIDVFDLWFYQKDFSIQANPGFGVTRLLLSKNRLSDCFMSENCQMHFVSIGPEGDVYPCNRFYGIEDYRLGNIVKDNFAEVLKSEKRKHLLSRCATRIDECKDCDIAMYCNGGCVHHAVSHYGVIEAPDHLCKVYRGLIKHALHRLEDVIESE